MDLRRARTFVAVADTGTVSAAAVRVRVAQPALSRQIIELEQEFGLKLFDRIGRRLVLTGEGEQLLADCRGLLSQADAVVERAKTLRRGDAGLLKVAASPQLIESIIATFIHVFAQRYPKVDVKVTEAMGWPEVMGLLERHEVHLGQNLLHAVSSKDKRFSCCPLAAVDLLAVCHPDLLLGPSDRIDIAALAPHPLLLLDTGFVFRKMFDSACRFAGIEPKIAFESRTPHTLLAMAENRHGVAIIPSALRIKGYALRVVAVTYQGKPLQEPLAIFWNSQRLLPPYAVHFCELIDTYIKHEFPVTKPARP